METFKMVIMKVGKTENGLILSEETIRNSLDSFINAPIIFNDNQTLTNYNDTEFVNKYNQEYFMGYIMGNIEIKNDYVYADVAILQEHIDKFRPLFNNWSITFEDGKRDKFILNSIELF
jgi:hypothetical protein